jgi:uncharacterized membrane protein YphA (DoxX/SURF4 family)
MIYSRFIQIILRLGLGIPLLIAGESKVADPAMFGAAISTFQILPSPLIPTAALGLPFLEIILGSLLVMGWRVRSAAFSATLLLAIYTVVLSLGLARHLPVECDCYGSSTSAPLSLIRDGILFGGGAFLYILNFPRNQTHPPRGIVSLMIRLK